MSADHTPRRFSEVSALTATGAGTFVAEVDAEWTIGGKPNGGYLLAMLARAAVDRGEHDDVVCASAMYLRAPEPGRVVVDAELLRAGRSASHVRVRMSQEGVACVEALIITGQLDGAAVADWTGGSPPISGAAYEDAIPLPARRADGARVAIMGQVSVRLDPDSTGFTSGQPTGSGTIRGWLALPGDEAFDPVSLCYAVDGFPPATFDIRFTGWVPTLQLSAYVRARPAPGPVRVLQQVGLIDGGRFDESCHVWDRTGRLVAHSVQLAGIRLSPGQPIP